MILSLILGLFFNPVFGMIWLGVGVPFSWAVVAAGLVLLGVLALIHRVFKKRVAWPELFQAFSIGLLLLWVSLLVSYREIPGSTDPQAMATAGFPLKTFTYPFPPMGSDQPPMAMWPNFFLNFLIWFAVGALISHFLPKKAKTTLLPLLLSLYLLLWGIGYLGGMFD